MPQTLARLVPFFRPSQRTIAVMAIAEKAYKLGQVAGYEEGYANGWKERDGLAGISGQAVLLPRQRAAA